MLEMSISKVHEQPRFLLIVNNISKSISTRRFIFGNYRETDNFLAAQTLDFNAYLYHTERSVV